VRGNNVLKAAFASVSFEYPSDQAGFGVHIQSTGPRMCVARVDEALGA